MKNKLKDFCASIGIEYCGVAPAGPYRELEAILRKRLDKDHVTEFDEPDIEKRINPRLTMPDVRSVVVCLFPYYTSTEPNSNLSKYTYSIDYHKVIQAKMAVIGSYLKSQINGFSFMAFTDTGPLVDRYLAYLAGLGFYGINSHIITDKYGSYVFIGYMLTNYPFIPDEPLDMTCIKCGRCIRSCPGGIILGDFNIDPRHCKSYLTQKKGELTRNETEILRKTPLAFGCDICQDVCPHNKAADKTKIAEFTDNIIHKLDYKELSQISNKDFFRRFGDHAFSWRGKKILLRNLDYLRNN